MASFIHDCDSVVYCYKYLDGYIWQTKNQTHFNIFIFPSTDIIALHIIMNQN